MLKNLTFWIVITVSLVAWRLAGPIANGTYIDWLLALAIIITYKCLPPTADWLVTILSFIGVHSMNIFLFHTFIYYYYWQDLIYWTRNPFLIFLTLLIVSLIISIAIETVKKKLNIINGKQINVRQYDKSIRRRNMN